MLLSGIQKPSPLAQDFSAPASFIALLAGLLHRGWQLRPGGRRHHPRPLGRGAHRPGRYLACSKHTEEFPNAFPHP